MSQELDELKVEAKELGIKVPGNISLNKLQDKVNAVKSELGEDIELDVKPAKVKLSPKKQAKLIGGKLIRVRITCHDPQFKKHKGIIRAAGSTLYFKKRYVPFNSITHIEQVIYDFMKQAQYQWFEEKINRSTGRKYKVPRTSPAFVIEVLPNLTSKELKDLAKDQATRGAIGDE